MRTNPRLEALRSQFHEVEEGIDTIMSRASADGLDEAADADLARLYARAEELRPEIEQLAERERSMNATADVLSRLGVGQPARSRAAATPAVQELSAGEWFSLYARANDGDRDAQAVLSRAVADQTTADLPGMLPLNIIGPIIKLADDRRPVFESFSSRPMPEKGKQFEVPVLVRRPAIAEQMTEKAELTSQSMAVSGDTVTKRTFGGVLDVSQQTIDWTEPSFLQEAITEFGGVWGSITEEEAVAFLLDKTVREASWSGSTVGSIVTSVTGGFQTVYDHASEMPDTLWLSLDEALALAGTTNDDDSVTAMSMLKRALADAGMSLNIVTGPKLPANTRILGVSRLVRSYEQRKGLLQAINVPMFGLDIGYAGYIAFYGRSEGLVSLT